MSADSGGSGGQPAVPTLTVGVVVCAFTMARWEQLSAGVRELARQTAAGDRVVVVIDHNEELLARSQEQLESSAVVVTANAGAVGLSAGRNTGIGSCACDVVLFLDDDAFPEAGWINAYRDRFAQDSDVIAIGGAVIADWEGGRIPRWFPTEFGWVVGCDYRGMPPSGSEIRNPIGASMGMRRIAFDTVGGFADDLGRVGAVPLGCEETELSIRIRQRIPGSRIIRDTTSTVRHYVPKSRQTVKYFLSRCFHEGQSKAVITRLVGSADALSSERSYAVKTLVSGLGVHLAEALRGDVGGLSRAALVPLGFAVTVAGYVKATLRRR